MTRYLFRASLLTILAALAVVVCVTHVILRSFLGKPLHYLQSRIDRIAKGDYGYEPRTYKQAEIESILSKFNEMAAKIEARENNLADLNVRLKAEILEREHSEQALRVSEERFRTYFEQSLLPMAITLPNKSWDKVNDRLVDLLGYSREELSSMTWSELTHSEDLDRNVEQFERMLADEIEGYSLEKRFIHKSGAIVFTILSVGLVRKPDGSPDYILAQFQDITERKQMEQALLRTQFSVDHAQDAVYWVGPDAELLYVNETACQTLGYSREELLSMTVFDIDPVFPRETWREHWDKIRESDSYLIETQHQTKGGNLFPVEIAIRVMRDDGVAYHSCFARDITERKQAEAALRNSEAVLKSLLEATPVGVSLLQNRTFVKVNTALCRITGYSEDEMIGMFTRILYPDEEEFVRVGTVGYQQMEREGLGVLESRLKRKDGTVIEVMLCLSPFDPKDLAKGATATVLDITDRKQAEEEMRRLRNYLSNIINSMPSMLIGVDTAGRVTQWNAAAERATGLTPEDSQGRPLTQVLPMLRDQMDRVRQAMQAHKAETHARVPCMMGGEIRYQDITVYPLMSNGVEGAVIRIDDVTERVRIEEMMIQSEKMLSVGGLAAGMAHEINNPLGVMLQASQNMLRRVSPDLPANTRVAEECGTTLDAVRKYLEQREILQFLEDVQDSGIRAAQIVEDMLSFSRKPESEGSLTNLAELLDRTLHLAGSDYDLKKRYDFRQIEIVREYQQDVPLVACQPSKMQQVFLNILRNGAEAMRETVNSGRLPRFHLRVMPEGGMVRVEIEDNGPGMDEATRRRVFEPFFTTKPPGIGTGLGMSVSYFIITDDHGGTLTVESQQGTGTRFIIRLPATRKE